MTPLQQFRFDLCYSGKLLDQVLSEYSNDPDTIFVHLQISFSAGQAHALKSTRDADLLFILQNSVACGYIRRGSVNLPTLPWFDNLYRYNFAPAASSLYKMLRRDNLQSIYFFIEKMNVWRNGELLTYLFSPSSFYTKLIDANWHTLLWEYVATRVKALPSTSLKQWQSETEQRLFEE